MRIDAEFPSKLQFLFKESRYKVAYGGRGSAKSWSFARALLIQGLKRSLRILCAREVQRSIKQSVHTLLLDQIKNLGLESLYEITENEIRGKNGTVFSFTGLSTLTVDSIKSFEGVDIVWVEEGQTVSRKSWDILIPTIRKPDSEIWVTFNPDLDTDDTYRRFVESPPDNAIVVKVNYTDNPWFPSVLEQERAHCQQVNKRDYPNIWEGNCRATVDGAIYADEIVAAHEQKRIRPVPYDPMLKVHVIFDIGWNDAMSVILAQRVGSQLMVIDYLEDSHKTFDYYSGVLKEKKLNWGKLWLPHDGKAKSPQTGKSPKQIMQALGWTVEIVPDIGVEEGIMISRMAFPRIYLDKEKTTRLVECLKHYKRAINNQTNEPGHPLHDEYSHGADAFRYMCVVVDQMSNEKTGNFFRPIKYDNRGIV